MIIKFKDGNVRQTAYNPRLAARLIALGNQIDYDADTTPEQREHEQREIQKQYDWIQDVERCRSYTVS